MLNISTYEIITYMKCPKRAEFSKGFVKKENPIVETITTVVQNAHLYYSRYGKLPSWNNIRHMITRQIQENMSGLIERKNSIELIVGRIQKWYSEYFIKNYTLPGITNVPLYLSLGHFAVLSDKVPLVLFSDKIELVDFKEVLGTVDYQSYETGKMRNDFELQLRIWIWWKTSTILPEKYSRIVIGKEGLKIKTINVERKLLEEIVEPIVKHVVNGIQQRVYYRSRSEQCGNCPFFTVCQP